MAVRFVASYLGIRPPGSGDENMIDLEYAKESFRQYLSHYDRNDDKIMLSWTQQIISAGKKRFPVKTMNWRFSLHCSMTSEGLNSLKPLTVTMIISLIMLSLA